MAVDGTKKTKFTRETNYTHFEGETKTRERVTAAVCPQVRLCGTTVAHRLSQIAIVFSRVHSGRTWPPNAMFREKASPGTCCCCCCCTHLKCVFNAHNRHRHRCRVCPIAFIFARGKLLRRAATTTMHVPRRHGVTRAPATTMTSR